MTTESEINFQKLKIEWIVNITNSSITAAFQNNLIVVNSTDFCFYNIEYGSLDSMYKHNLKNPCVVGVIFNKKLVIGDCSDRSLNIWYIDKLNEQPILRIQTSYELFCLTVLKNGDIAISWNNKNNEIVILDSYIGLIKNRLLGHTNKISQILQTRDEYLISSSIDKSIIIWDQSGVLIKKLKYEEGVISFDITNYLLAVGLASKQIELINLKNGRLVKSLQSNSELCEQQCLQFLDDQSLLTASVDKILKIWNPNYEKINSTINSHLTAIEQVFKNSNYLFTRSKTEIIKWSTVF